MATDDEIRYWLSCLPHCDDETLAEALKMCDASIKSFTGYREQVIAEQLKRMKK